MIKLEINFDGQRFDLVAMIDCDSGSAQLQNALGLGIPTASNGPHLMGQALQQIHLINNHLNNLANAGFGATPAPQQAGSNQGGGFTGATPVQRPDPFYNAKGVIGRP